MLTGLLIVSLVMNVIMFITLIKYNKSEDRLIKENRELYKSRNSLINKLYGLSALAKESADSTKLCLDYETKNR